MADQLADMEEVAQEEVGQEEVGQEEEVEPEVVKDTKYWQKKVSNKFVKVFLHPECYESFIVFCCV